MIAILVIFLDFVLDFVAEILFVVGEERYEERDGILARSWVRMSRDNEDFINIFNSQNQQLS